MRKFVVLLFVCLLSTPCFAESIMSELSAYQFGGSRLAAPIDVSGLTDAAPTATVYVPAKKVSDVVVDVTTDKGLTVVITPVLDENRTIFGPVSETGTIADGGGTDRFAYTNISALWARVVVTKTEVGDTSSFSLSVRGRN